MSEKEVRRKQCIDCADAYFNTEKEHYSSDVWNAILHADGSKFVGWTAQKPVLDRPCILLTASKTINRDYKYETESFIVCPIYDSRQFQYWGICEMDGEEWGAYEDLKADFYLIVDYPKGERE